ncbi:MAG: 4Fe-4S ferredoxin iron-sulfur binding domain protein [Myxococcales bacterium]|nr:4Fe-4S ferredoxin iron-sulfur binding domain protein [Myxococcales bacterium]
MVPLLVFSGLAGFAIFCVLISAAFGGLKKRSQAKRLLNAKRKLLVHSINDDRCTGCEACVTVCPTDVLELQSNKSRVERMSDCIQCEQCVSACPTQALVMHYEGTKPPTYRMPQLDDYYQAAAGLYLVGEAAGKPLVKNASNLGRAVVEHMLATGLRPTAYGNGQVDVLIVGSGPGGLSAALSCVQRGLSYALIEKDELVAATIARWPKGKECMAEPYDVKCVGLLPVWDSGKDELLAAWRTILDKNRIHVSTRETVEDVQRDTRGWFNVKTNKQVYSAQRVILSIGTRGKPRKLGVPGEALTKVTPLLNDPAEHRGQRVLVVGGGDSAVEAAIALAETAQRVTLSYRGKALSRCKAKNRQKLDEVVKAGRVVLRYATNVSEIKQDSVTLKAGDQHEQIANDHVFVCIGGDAPIKWLESVGVKFIEQPHLFSRGPTDKLVEKLVGPQRETTREGAGGGAAAAVMVDVGSFAGVELEEQRTVIRFPVEKVRRIA